VQPPTSRSDQERSTDVPEIKLAAEARSEFGKGAARRLRRANLIPAVLYGHGTDPQHVSLPRHATFMALKKANVLLTIDLDGNTQLALPKDVQRDPVRDIIEHVDLLIVKRGGKVIVDVPVRVIGEAESGTVVTNEATSLSLEVEATNIPTSIEVSIEGAAAGTSVKAGEITLPKGAALAGDPETTIVHVSGLSQSSEAVEAEGEDAAAE
jgi:large subunit ribosomal protein L25